MSPLISHFSVIFAIAYRGVMTYTRDRQRLMLSIFFPMILIGVLGVGVQTNFSSELSGYDFLTFIFVGVIAQSVFQTVAQSAILGLTESQKNQTQGFYVSPAPRLIIIVGAIIGELGVGFLQGFLIIIFGLVVGVSITASQFLWLLLTIVVVGFFGGSFGIFIASTLGTDEKVTRILFPLLIFPQLFLAGVFFPIKNLPFALLVVSRTLPLTYAVDFMRTVFYSGTDISSKIVIFDPLFDLFIIALYTWIFIISGTFFLTRHERNR